jgi:hypothetical protein
MLTRSKQENEQEKKTYLTHVAIKEMAKPAVGQMALAGEKLSDAGA